jgi:hypothetical protein
MFRIAAGETWADTIPIVMETDEGYGKVNWMFGAFISTSFFFCVSIIDQKEDRASVIVITCAPHANNLPKSSITGSHVCAVYTIVHQLFKFVHSVMHNENSCHLTRPYWQ